MASNLTGVRNPYQSCPLDELITCDDQPSPRSPRSTWWVYRAYANTSGVMLNSERRCEDADVLASYDDAHGEPTAWAVLGYYGDAFGRTVRLRWDSVPTALQRKHADGSHSVRVTVALIRNTLQEPALSGPEQLSDAAISLVDGSLSLAVKLGSQDVATVRLRLPSKSDDGDWSAPPLVAVSYTDGPAPATINQIFLVGADGSSPRQLTSAASAPHGAVQPSFSPDGTQVAYSEPTPQGMHLMLMRTDGSSQPRVLTRGKFTSNACDSWGHFTYLSAMAATGYSDMLPSWINGSHLVFVSLPLPSFVDRF